VDDTVLLGLAKVLGISLVPVLVLGAALHARTAVARCAGVARRWHLARPAPAPPAGPPLERLAADLRRLRPEARTPSPGVPMARQRGIVAAYDEVLEATAAALDVPTTLGELPDGIDREAERLRLEHALEVAGLSWQVPRERRRE
jgi:hypothetical protein